MKVYRMKHMPTGLYYTPSRKIRVTGSKSIWVKSNLSKKGKLYPHRPTLAWIGPSFYDHTLLEPLVAKLEERWLGNREKEAYATRRFVEAEWQIEEVVS